MTAILTSGVTKRFGERVVVDGIDLAIAPGEKVALLGHNGAGKTTLIRMILGLIPIDDGRITILGHTPGTVEARRTIAYLPETVAFHRLVTAREQLRLFAAMRGEPAGVADALLERVDLAADAGRRLGTFSKGMRQRLGLAQVLLGRPRVALLDEPTSGLDPIARSEFYTIVDELAVDGVAVLLSSHALTEVEARTDRIVMMRAGRIVADDALPRLRRAAALPVRIRITARDDSSETLLDELGGKPVNGRSIELLCHPDDKLTRMAAIAARRPMVEDIEIIPPNLDDIYRHFSGTEDSA